MPQYSDVSDIQLQLRCLELDHAREQRDQEREREEREQEREKEERQQQLELKKLELEQGERDRERQQQYELKKLELEMSTASGPSARPTDPPSSRPPPFRVEAAVKLVPKFSENDVETFLISCEKVAELNNFPLEKYAAILQAHLTGKALKVLAELSVKECRDYPTLKAALFQAYSVVPEVYRKRFHNLSKSDSETYSEFAFGLGTRFTRWLESEGAYSDVELLRDLMQHEQFQSNLDSGLHVWLIDQKPKNLSEASRLADQYVAVWEADRTAFKGHEFTFKGHATKPKSHGKSGRSSASAGFQKTSFNHNTKPHDEQKSSTTSSSAKFVRVLCFQ